MAEDSNVVIISIVLAFHYLAFLLFDPESTFSYVWYIFLLELILSMSHLLCLFVFLPLWLILYWWIECLDHVCRPF